IGGVPRAHKTPFCDHLMPFCDHLRVTRVQGAFAFGEYPPCPRPHARGCVHPKPCRCSGWRGGRSFAGHAETRISSAGGFAMSRSHLRTLAALAVLLLSTIPGADARAGDLPGTGRAEATRSVVYAKHGMVACAQ